MKKFYITTPIYYSSGKPHIGHAYSTIMADVLARYKKLLGYETFFLTGMDEHGQKIEEKAKENGLNPQQLIDQNALIFQDLWKKLNISEDFFIRTSNEKHKLFVQAVFQKLLKKEYIYKSIWKTMYCVSCEENIRESNVVYQNDLKQCIHGHHLIEKEEESYFLKVSLFKQWLIDYYQANPDFIYPNTRVKELVNNFLNEEFEDLSVTRKNVSWGIAFPGDETHTIYVWIDALLNYLSSLSINQNLEKFWTQDSQKVHILSKEITRFHCIYWPILLKMLDYDLPTIILSHGWIVTKNISTNENVKMSKSLNNIIDPIDIISEYNSDVLRYFLMKSINVTSDSVFDFQNLLFVYNADLANNFGNIVSRTIGMLKKYHAGVVPSYETIKHDINLNFKNEIESLFNKFKKVVDQLDVNKIVHQIDQIANAINLFIENSKPWNYVKEQQNEILNEFLLVLYNAVKVYVFCLQPILVDASILAIEQLNIKKASLTMENIFNLKLNNAIIVNESSPIFLRKVQK